MNAFPGGTGGAEEEHENLFEVAVARHTKALVYHTNTHTHTSTHMQAQANTCASSALECNSCAQSCVYAVYAYNIGIRW